MTVELNRFRKDVLIFGAIRAPFAIPVERVNQFRPFLSNFYFLLNTQSTRSLSGSVFYQGRLLQMKVLGLGKLLETASICQNVESYFF